MKGGFVRAIERQWYASSPGWLWCLVPLECIFRILVFCRRRLHKGNADIKHPPLIVVGNISIGGTGKTPVIISLVKYFTEQGMRVGVVSRGYGRSTHDTRMVSSTSASQDVGDEPLEIFRATGVAICVGRDRNQAVERLCQAETLDMILSDDGLQHYKMPRDIELVVCNAERPLGNEHCLPLGPLREPKSRLNHVDAILINRNVTAEDDLQSALDLSEYTQKYTFSILPSHWANVKTGKIKALGELDSGRYIAYAGLGQPKKFFDTLSALGLEFDARPKADHAEYSEADFNMREIDGKVVQYLMTAKDAVKCESIAHEQCWYLQIHADLPSEFCVSLHSKILGLKKTS